MRRQAPSGGKLPASFTGNYGNASGSSGGPHFATGRSFAVDEKASEHTRDTGEGMERLRLCVSLLQKQVHVSPCNDHVIGASFRPLTV